MLFPCFGLKLADILLTFYKVSSPILSSSFQTVFDTTVLLVNHLQTAFKFQQLNSSGQLFRPAMIWSFTTSRARQFGSWRQICIHMGATGFLPNSRFSGLLLLLFQCLVPQSLYICQALRRWIWAILGSAQGFLLSLCSRVTLKSTW